MVFDTRITWSWLAFCILTLIFFFFFLVFFHYFYSRRFKHVFSRTLWNKALGKVLHLTLLWKEKKSTLGTKNEKTLLSLLLLLLPKLPSTSSDLQNNTRNIFAIWTDNYPINNHLIKKGQHQDTLLDLPNLHCVRYADYKFTIIVFWIMTWKP